MIRRQRRDLHLTRATSAANEAAVHMSCSPGPWILGERDAAAGSPVDCLHLTRVRPHDSSSWGQSHPGRKGARITAAVTVGRVPDVRPWLQAAAVVVAPLRIARGVQNKVLEAMAMARPVVATGAALQGLGEVDTPGVHRADSAADFAAAVCNRLAQSGAKGEAQDNRQFVLRRFSWPAALEPLWPLLEAAA